MTPNGFVPVTSKRHHNRYWRRFASYEFAAKWTACAVVCSEITEVAAVFPILFQQTERGVEPVALLSMSTQLCSPLVAADGRWLARYIPSALRGFPFKAERVNDKQYRLLVHEGSGSVTSDPNDIPFFINHTDLSPELHDLLAFLRAREAAADETREICAQMQSLGLFAEFSIEDNSISPPNLLMIDPDKLGDCFDGPHKAAIPNRALKLIHAHQISLSHCDWLSGLQRQQQVRTLEASGELRGFISAIGQQLRCSQQVDQVTYALG